MANILILTMPGDYHAQIVKGALERKGHNVCLWFGADFPTRQVGSFIVSSDVKGHWEITGQKIDINSEMHFDTVWNRRYMSPALPIDMHSGDRLIAERECTHFLNALWPLIESNVFWVNSIQAAEFASQKPLQLFFANQIGFHIPPTIISNDGKKIRDFIRQFEGEVIFKAFQPIIWRKHDGGEAYLPTSLLQEKELPDDEVLRLCPGIFQPKIEKKYELRATFMGGKCFTVKILSQLNPKSSLDWREDLNPRLEPYDLPDSLYCQCRDLMRRLGIVFGCFDFIVTPSDDYVFLEVNEMGQFLFIEEMIPELHILDAFCDFLIHQNQKCNKAVQSPPVRLVEFDTYAKNANAMDMLSHVKPDLARMFVDD